MLTAPKFTAKIAERLCLFGLSVSSVGSVSTGNFGTRDRYLQFSTSISIGSINTIKIIVPPVTTSHSGVSSMYS